MTSETKASSSSAQPASIQFTPMPLDCTKAATGVWLVKVDKSLILLLKKDLYKLYFDNRFQSIWLKNGWKHQQILKSVSFESHRISK